MVNCRTRHGAAVLAGSLCCIALAIGIAEVSPVPYGAPGTFDFIQYWVSWHLIERGLNPYDPVTFQAAQDAITLTQQPLMMSWNPPWTHVLLAPILALPFENAASFWRVIQVALLALIAVVGPQALGIATRRLVLTALAVSLFFPTLSAIYWGQLGTLLAASIVFFLFFERQGQYLLAGLALIPLTTKPHLFLLCIPPALAWMWSLPKGSLARFLLGSAGGFVALLGATTVASPPLMRWWLYTFAATPGTISATTGVHYQDWMTATLTTWVRVALTPLRAEVPTWPLIGVPIAGFVGSSLYFLARGKPIVWSRITPPLLCLSLLFSNYGWSFDQSVLVVSQLALIGGALALTDPFRCSAVIGAAFVMQVVAICLSDLPQHYFTWLPIGMALLLFIEHRMKSAQERA